MHTADYILFEKLKRFCNSLLIWGFIFLVLIFVPDLSLASDSSRDTTTQTVCCSESSIGISALSGIIGAFIGGVFSFVAVSWQAKLARKNELQRMADQDKLCRINDQISKFYAPLLTLSKSGRNLWKKFCEEQGRCHDEPIKYFTEPGPASGKDLLDYIRVMREVFAPLNKQRMDIILSEAALIDNTEITACHQGCITTICRKVFSCNKNKNDGIPDYLIELVAHVSELNAMMKRWERICDENHAISFVGKEEDDPKNKDPKKKYSAFYPSCEFPKNLNCGLTEKYNCLRKRKEVLLDKWAVGEKNN